MPSDDKFDAIVIGAGIAGLGVAALLAKDHGQRVLVLERAPFVGGRALSYVGRGDKVTADGLVMDAREFTKSLAHVHCLLAKCEPSIDEIFARGLLDVLHPAHCTPEALAHWVAGTPRLGDASPVRMHTATELHAMLAAVLAPSSSASPTPRPARTAAEVRCAS